MVGNLHRSAAVLAVLVALLLGSAWSASRAADTSTSAPASASPASASGWQVTAPTASDAVEGYASEVSVVAGDTLHLHVSTSPAAHYLVEIYRIGWYGATGGGRVACVPTGCVPHAAGAALPVQVRDTVSGELHAGWPVSDEIAVPPDWRSGYYLAKLLLMSGPDAGRSAGIPFIVRAPAGSTASALVVAPVNTWQAYNTWGGLSMYSDPKAAVKVSFDRPYATADTKVYLDYPIVRFLDQFGYDAAFTTDADIDADPSELTRHRLVVFPSHSEYWTKAMRDGLEAARGLGVNLAFLGGNTGCAAVGYEWDAVAPECETKSPRLTVLFHYTGRATLQEPGVYTSTFHSTNADAVRYEARSGAIVLAAGSIDFALALTGSADGSPVAAGLIDPAHPPDPRLQRFMRNAIDDLVRPRGP